MSKKISNLWLEPSKVLVPTQEKGKFVLTIKLEAKITEAHIHIAISKLIFEASRKEIQSYEKKSFDELCDMIDLEICCVKMRSDIAHKISPESAAINNCKLMYPEQFEQVTKRIRKELIDNYGTECI